MFSQNRVQQAQLQAHSQDHTHAQIQAQIRSQIQVVDHLPKNQAAQQINMTLYQRIKSLTLKDCIGLTSLFVAIASFVFTAITYDQINIDSIHNDIKKLREQAESQRNITNTHNNQIESLKNIREQVKVWGQYEQREDSVDIKYASPYFEELMLKNGQIIIDLDYSAHIYFFAQLSIQLTNTEFRFGFIGGKKGETPIIVGSESIQQWKSDANGVRSIQINHMYDAKEPGQYIFTFRFRSYGATGYLARFQGSVMSVYYNMK